MPTISGYGALVSAGGRTTVTSRGIPSQLGTRVARVASQIRPPPGPGRHVRPNGVAGELELAPTGAAIATATLTPARRAAARFIPGPAGSGPRRRPRSSR